METIWLQRPSADIPWGFRLQGGQDFDLPLSVQKVTQGSVASNGLSQGDIVLKIGNVNATGISHSEAQEVIKGASNILQLTIKKGSTTSAPVSPTSTGYQYQQPSYNNQYDDQDRYSTMPDYRVGSGYNGYSSKGNQPGGYNYPGENSPYDMRQLQQQMNQPPVSGYSTLPVRGGSKQNNESFRPVQQQQNKYPYKSTTGITLQMTPQSQHQNVQRNDYPPSSYSHPMSPVQYDNRSDSPYMRQLSNSSGRSEPTNYPQSYYKKPTPFSPTYNNGNDNIPMQPQLQRQQSSGQYNGNRYDANVSQGYQPQSYSPQNDEAPPPPPPPVNYRQPEQYGRPSYDQEVPYQRQSSQQGYQSSPYSQQSDPYNQYQNNRQNQGIYVDTSSTQPQYQRQGSRPYDQPSVPEPYQRQQSLQRQTSYGSQAPTQPQYSTPYSQPPQSYSRQSSRDQAPPSSYSQIPAVSTPPSSGTGINSFDEILSPFEKFQNSNYCDKLFARSPDQRGDDSGVMSDMSYSMSDTPRSNQSSNLSEYSPATQTYPGGYDNRVSGQQSLLRPAPPTMPPLAITPPPPPPPPPPSDWAPAPKKLPPQSPHDIGGEQQMPDKVLNTMLKHGGTQKPFAYVPTGADLKEFKERARQRRQPRSVMPRGYVGPDLDTDDLPAEPQPPQNSKTAGANSTPERRPSDIKDSEVYKMIKVADAQGYKPKKPRNPLLRHNSEDDEMRFSGLHSKADIPSKAFHRLNKLAVHDSDNQYNDAHGSNEQQNNENDEAERVGNYDEASIRYRGNHIPSPSFRLLQSLAKTEEEKQKSGSPLSRTDDEDDGLPDKLSEEDMVDKRYTGGALPSKAFKALQMSIDNKPESASSNQSVNDDGTSKIKVLSRAPKVAPKPADRPITPVKAQIRQQRMDSPSTDF